MTLSTLPSLTRHRANSSGPSVGLAPTAAVLLVSALVAVLAGCRQTKPTAEYGTVEMQIGGRTFHLEIAATQTARANALARGTLPADHGVILAFRSELPREIPVNGARIPLDLVCLDASGTVVSVEHAAPAPAQAAEVATDHPTKYVLELNQGAAAGAGLKPGDKLPIPPEVRLAAPDAGTVEMRIGHRTFQLEVAATESAREYGLMNRPSMAPDHGMIFVFAGEEPREFWMKNTLIPLDIVYLDASGKVVSIKHGTPKQEQPTVPSDAPMKYAVELNAGAAAAAGLKVGDQLTVPPEAREPAEGG